MDSKRATVKKHCFVEEDDGLASIAAGMEIAGVSGNHHYNHYPLVSRPMYYSAMQRKSSFRNFSAVSLGSPRSAGRFCEEPQQPYFLDACFLCKKPLGANSDIFMYRGDTPFCSEECRQEQIETDEAKEKSFNLSASMRAMRKKEQRKSTSSNKSTQESPLRPSTVAAA